jgi:hypothetical protein
MANSDYTLVKDKDGQLKYFKGGEFYSIEEVENEKVPITNNQSSIIKDKNQKSDNKHQISLKSEKKEEKEVGGPVKRQVLQESGFRGVKDDGLKDAGDGKRALDQGIVNEGVDSVVKKLKIKFTESEIENRFKKIVVSFFRGLRDAKETQYMMSVPKIDGGLEIKADKASVIVRVLAQEKEIIEKKRKAVATDRKEVSEDESQESEKAKKQESKNKEEGIGKKLSDDLIPFVAPDHRLAPPPPMVVEEKEEKENNKARKQESNNLKQENRDAVPVGRQASLDRSLRSDDFGRDDKGGMNDFPLRSPSFEGQAGRDDKGGGGKRNVDLSEKVDIKRRKEEKSKVAPMLEKAQKRPNKSLEDVLAKVEASYNGKEKEAPKRRVLQTGRPDVLRKVEKSVEQKPKLDDIKAKRRAYGPLEELENMDISSFRMLDSDPKRAGDIVLEKIYLLEDQSYVKKVQGVTAWRNSPIFGLYLKMSMQGITDKRSIEQVIEDRQRNNEPALSISEYEMVSKLNQQISY